VAGAHRGVSAAVRRRKGFRAAAFTDEVSRTVAGNNGKELMQVGKSDKGVRDKQKWKEGGKGARRRLSSGTGEAVALSHDSGELRWSNGGQAVQRWRTRGGVLLWALPRGENGHTKGITDVAPTIFKTKPGEGEGAQLGPTTWQRRGGGAGVGTRAADSSPGPAGHGGDGWHDHAPRSA
jgi:hypothetical protein